MSDAKSPEAVCQRPAQSSRHPEYKSQTSMADLQAEEAVAAYNLNRPLDHMSLALDSAEAVEAGRQ